MLSKQPLHHKRAYGLAVATVPHLLASSSPFRVTFWPANSAVHDALCPAPAATACTAPSSCAPATCLCRLLTRPKRWSIRPSGWKSM